METIKEKFKAKINILTDDLVNLDKAYNKALSIIEKYKEYKSGKKSEIKSNQYAFSPTNKSFDFK